MAAGGEPMLTALCLRALLSNQGAGLAVESALGYLAGLQQDSGIWPRVPLRRFPGDPVGLDLHPEPVGPRRAIP